MKRATAIRHLVEMAEVATARHDALGGTEIGWPLQELWVGGELLTTAAVIDLGLVVLVLDTPSDELSSMAQHRDGEFVGDQLRLGKRPFAWSYRPSGVAVWTPEHRRLVRFWSRAEGMDAAVIEALDARDIEGLGTTDPSDPEVELLARDELVAAKRHLAEVLDRYWDRGWCKKHSGYDTSPEDTLWRAAQAVRELQDIVDGELS